ncbi:hypothetical protein GPECTOR_14g16 [Gonium pectorale]|uniref:Apple domain-containing protein n=1 Tax=Gonium pectorale TaxID=33097 RepID=A0A150GM43_GONPE|nr:hypothetical protein GPECTOR_14g16 [Gonium pectorale]|eukprot:KXZ50913.1 hypothetical protein GPECTOR_14g16 [Gonium pectorale]
MGKKKAFIDKKKAVTYSLVYRDPSEEQDGEDGGERTLALPGGHRGAGAPVAEDDDYDYYDEAGSLYESEYSMCRSAAEHADPTYAMTEERRRELLSLGFPDDGYDYLRHLRDLGRGRPAAGRGGVETIHEDQELEGFDEDGDFAGEEDEDGSDDDFTIYDEPPPPGAEGAKLDAAALATAAAAAGPSTSTAGAAAGPGPSSSRGGAGGVRGAVGSVRGGARSVATRSVAPGGGVARSSVARSVASTARSHGSAVGPSVYVPAKVLVAPREDVKVVDARRLVVRPKGHDEAAAAAALAEVSAMARATELHGKRGKLYQDLDELEKSMAAMENGNDPNRAEVVEGDEWADWLDGFVAGTIDEGEAAGGAAGGRAGRVEEEQEDEESDEGGDSEEPEEEDEEADEWRNRHRQQRQQEQQHGAGRRGGQDEAGHDEEEEEEEEQEEEGKAGRRAAAPGPGPGTVAAAAGRRAASTVASSFWRPERRDRKEGLDALDAKFERLAVEYDDDQIGDLEHERYGDDDKDEDGDEGFDGDGPEGRAARARAAVGAARQAAAGQCELSDFADVLDEFLAESRTAQLCEEEGLRPLQALDDVVAVATRPDPEALAATRARMHRQLEAAERAAAAAAAAGREYEPADEAQAEPRSTLVLKEAERWDCESVLSFTSNLENHPGKIVEPQRRTGGKGGGLIRLSAKTGMPVTGGARSGGPAAIPEEGECDDEEDAADVGEGASGSGSENGNGAAANPDGDVCYEGCFAAPIGGLADPLPLYLRSSRDAGEPISLVECYTSAVEAGVTHFAIVDKIDCFGGNSTLVGWAPDSCTIDCVPDGPAPNACGDTDKAVLFSMGLCRGKQYRCKPGLALWGSFLSGSPLKLSPKRSAEDNAAECERLCSARVSCKGYYYKRTGWCYLMSQVAAFGKEYSTAVRACKVVNE